MNQATDRKVIVSQSKEVGVAEKSWLSTAENTGSVCVAVGRERRRERGRDLAPEMQAWDDTNSLRGQQNFVTTDFQ